MAETWFTPKEWKARLVEFAGRRLLRNVANGQSATYDVSRSEGLVSQEGDAFNTKNMNDLEQRISNGFANAKTNIDALNRELGAGDGEMSLKSMVSELYGKLANFDLIVDISKYFSTNTAQVFEVKSSADLSGYEYIAICATFQRGKSGNFTEISGCEILDQLGWEHTMGSDAVAIHLVILKNITGAISILGRAAGTGSATVKAFGFK
nr:MAG: hypothetical protein [Bacteriophage sp.]